MDIKKSSLKRILTVLMVFAVLTALSVPAFAEAAAVTPAGNDANAQNENTDTEKDKQSETSKDQSGLTEDEEAELQDIYKRLEEIEDEFEALYEARKDEMAELRARADELEEKSGKFSIDRYFREFRDRFFGDHAFSPFGGMMNPWEMNPDDSFVPDSKPEQEENTVTEEKKPYIGIMISELPEEVTYFTGIQNGVVVQEVREDSPAEEAGMQAHDVITAVNDQQVSTTEELKALVAESKIGDTLCFHLYRQGKELDLDVTVAAN